MQFFWSAGGRNGVEKAQLPSLVGYSTVDVLRMSKKVGQRESLSRPQCFPPPMAFRGYYLETYPCWWGVSPSNRIGMLKESRAIGP
jgi:hypothetical protein